MEKPHKTRDVCKLSQVADGSVVNALGEAHEVPGLFVADASVFPTSIAVPPQFSVMAFATRTAQYIAVRGALEA